MSFRRKRLAALVAAGCVVVLGVPAVILSSDHQDAPEVELNPRCDINDVYAFPSPADENRIVLVMTTSSPLTPSQTTTASFDPDKLYQIKIDNNIAADANGDGVENLVLQFKFKGTGNSQTVDMRGPVAPPQTGTLNKLSNTAVTVSGGINTQLGSTSGIQLYCGRRDDPFFLDLEQFFKILPDRRPVTGPLSTPGTPATCFRDSASAVDYLSGYNTLAIVVEMPESMLVAGTNPRIGVWGTISR